MLASQNCTTHEVALVIEQDIAMSVKVLQLVNSAFFRLPRIFTRIEDAIVYLGFDVVSRIVLAGELFDIPPQRHDLTAEISSLRHHSLTTATIASKLMCEKKQQDDAFLAGLLHDVGKLLLAAYLPEHFRSAVEHAKNSGVDLYNAEIELSGVSHAEVGAYLLGLWGLPHFVVEAVAYHHRPTGVEEPMFGVLGAVHVGNALAHGIRGDTSTKLDTGYLAKHGLMDQCAEWERRFRSEFG
jgi:putative nucleotidyltransferase with HDIG domain